MISISDKFIVYTSLHGSDRKVNVQSVGNHGVFLVIIEHSISTLCVYDSILAVGCIDGSLYLVDLDTYDSLKHTVCDAEFTSLFDLFHESSIIPKLVYKFNEAVSLVLIASGLLYSSSANACKSIICWCDLSVLFHANVVMPIRCATVNLPVDFGTPTIARLLIKSEANLSFVQKTFGIQALKAAGPFVVLGSVTGNVAWFSTSVQDDIDISTCRVLSSSGSIEVVDLELLPRELAVLRGSIKEISFLNLRQFCDNYDHILVIDEYGSVYIKGVTPESPLLEGLVIEECALQLPLCNGGLTCSSNCTFAVWGGSVVICKADELNLVSIVIDKLTSEVRLGCMSLLSDLYWGEIEGFSCSVSCLCVAALMRGALVLRCLPVPTEVRHLSSIVDEHAVETIAHCLLGEHLGKTAAPMGDMIHASLERMISVGADENALLLRLSSIDKEILQLVSITDLLHASPLTKIERYIHLSAEVVVGESNGYKVSLRVRCSRRQLSAALNGQVITISTSPERGKSEVFSFSSNMHFSVCANDPEQFECIVIYPLYIGRLSAYELVVAACLSPSTEYLSNGGIVQLILGTCRLSLDDILTATAGALPINSFLPDKATKLTLTTHIPHFVDEKHKTLDLMTKLERRMDCGNIHMADDSLRPRFTEINDEKALVAAAVSNYRFSTLQVRYTTTKSRILSSTNAAVFSTKAKVEGSLQSGNNKLDVNTLSLRGNQPAFLAAVHAAYMRHLLTGLDISTEAITAFEMDSFRASDVYSMPTDLQRLYSECSQLLDTYISEFEDLSALSSSYIDPGARMMKIWSIYCRIRELGC